MAGGANRILFSLLNALTEEDLKHFQSLLDQRHTPDRELRVPKRRPKKSKYMDIVSQMVGWYGEDQALEVTLDLLGQVGTQISPELLQASQTYLDLRLYEMQEKAGHRKKYMEDVIERCQLQEENINFGQFLDLKNRYPKLLLVKNYFHEEGLVHEVLSLRKKHQEAWVKVTSNPYSNITELFETHQNGHTPRIVVLQGAAGIGKTTLVRKIILDWASGKLYQDKFDYVFYLQCRDIDKHHAPMSVADLLMQSCPDMAAHTVGLFSDPRKLLFIIDGFDELQCPFLVSEDGKPPTVDPQSALLRKSLLCKSSMIITTRTTALEKLRKCVKVQQLKEILGFSQEDIEEYFHEFCRNCKLGDQTCQKIHEKAELVSMCFVPIVCWIICSVIKHHVEKGEEFPCASNTMTLIYLSFFDSLLIDKTSDSINHTQHSLKKLCALAKDGVYDRKILFREEEISRYGLTISDIQSLLQNKVIFHKAAKDQNLYSFVHLSVQEFFAALFYVLRQNDDASERIGKQPDVMELLGDCSKPDHKHLLLTVRFVFGLVNPEAMKQMDKSRMWKISSEIKKDLFLWIKERIKNAEEINDRMMELLYCLFEIREEEFVKGALEHLKNIEIPHFHQLMGKLDFTVMLFYLANSPVIQNLLLSNNKMELEEIRALVPWTMECASLHLRSCSLSPPCCRELSILLSKSVTLKELVLGYSQIMDSGVALLCEGLRHPGCNIQKLNFCNCSLTGLCCEDLASVLSTTPSLEELTLADNTLSDSGVSQLCEGLQHPQCKLKKLDLWSCSLSPPCCRELSILLSKSVTLKELVLGYNQIMDSGVALLCEGLRHPGCNIQKLDFCNCSLTGLCCEDLASVLRTTPSLEELTLAVNTLGDSGVSQLCEGLQYPQCKLKKLELDECSLTGACCGDLASALCTNQTLTELSLRLNKLGDTGMHQLCDALKHPSCRIQILNLNDCSLSGSCCSVLSLALCTNTSLLELMLCRNELGDSGISQLCQGLKHPGCRLQKLWLLSCSLTGSCCADLASVLLTSSSLTELSLSDNELGDVGVTALCRGLEDPDCKIQTLDLWCCSFTASCCSDLASALVVSPNLTELTLSDNKLEDSGVIHLCEGLRHPNCKLQKLELDNASLTDACVTDLCSALSENQTLQSLDLNCNHFTDACIASFLQLKTNSSNLCDIRLRANDLSEHGREELKRLLDRDE